MQARGENNKEKHLGEAGHGVKFTVPRSYPTKAKFSPPDPSLNSRYYFLPYLLHLFESFQIEHALQR